MSLVLILALVSVAFSWIAIFASSKRVKRERAAAFYFGVALGLKEASEALLEGRLVRGDISVEHYQSQIEAAIEGRQ